MLPFLSKPGKTYVYCALRSLGDSQMLQILTGATAQGHTNTGNAASTFHREPLNEKTVQPAHYSTGKLQLIIFAEREEWGKKNQRAASGAEGRSTLTRPQWHSSPLEPEVAEKRQLSPFLHARVGTPVLSSPAVSPSHTHIQGPYRPTDRIIHQNSCCFHLFFLI